MNVLKKFFLITLWMQEETINMRFVILFVVALLILGCGKKNKKEIKVMPVIEKTFVNREDTDGISFPVEEHIDSSSEIEIPIINDVVLFDLNSAFISHEMTLRLDNVINMISGFPNLTISLKGACCPLGEEFYNFALGYQRAESVKNYLRKYIENPILLSSYGEAKLVSYNKETYYLNRRCEITLEQGILWNI